MRTRYSEVAPLIECTKEESINIGVYYIKSSINNKLYIGSTQNDSDYGFYRRWLNHYFYLKNNKHHSKYLQNHVNKYGIDKLRFGILEICNKENCLERESYWIKKLDTYNKGFNATKDITSYIIGSKHPKYINIDEEYVIDLYTNKILSCKKIAKLLNVSEGKIRRVLIKNNITIQSNIYRVPLTQIYYRYFLGGEALTKLSKEFHCSISQLRKELKKLGYKTKSEYMQSLKDEAIEFINKGGTLADFCKGLPVNYSSMCYVINEYYEKK
jgi:group I intron endonuclease